MSGYVALCLSLPGTVVPGLSLALRIRERSAVHMPCRLSVLSLARQAYGGGAIWAMAGNMASAIHASDFMITPAWLDYS